MPDGDILQESNIQTLCQNALLLVLLLSAVVKVVLADPIPMFVAVIMSLCSRERERDRETETDRQTDRQTYRQRQTDRDRQRERLID